MKTLIVDCLGCVFEESFYSHIQEPLLPLTDADYFRLKYENPNRSIENQQSTNDYLKACESFAISEGYDELYFIGTNGEVLTASHIIEPNANHYSNAPKYINTVDKFNFIRDFLVADGNEITFITDQYFSKIYSILNEKNNMNVKIKVIERNPTEVEIPDVEELLVKYNLK
ncbi:MAG: hypothetical protein ACRCXZ_04015 [Patescibacteria group bacterium]